MRITITGIDEHTNIEQLLEEVQPYAEIGILFSLTSAGRNRYPRPEWIAENAQRLSVCALHVCGNSTRRAIRTQCPAFVKYFQRMQINGVVSEAELAYFCQNFPAHHIITQHTVANSSLVQASVTNHQLLVDGSGGRGLVPSGWEAPATSKDVGFAGGLGPKTIGTELPRIQAVARDGWWIDMENGVRNKDDRFDVGFACETIDHVRRVLDGR